MYLVSIVDYHTINIIINDIINLLCKNKKEIKKK